MAALAGPRTLSAQTPGPGSLIAYTVSWPLTLEEGDSRQVASVICGVDLAGRTYRLTPISPGVLFTQPAWSPDGRRLAYEARTRFDASIAVGTLPSLAAAAGPKHASSPAWSPDGVRLAFKSPPDFTESGPQNLWVSNIDGSEWRRVTSGEAGDGNPSWSPDGRRLVFDSFRGGSGRQQLYVVDADGSGLSQLTSSEVWDTAPDWSPDGAAVIFASGRSFPGSIELVNVDGSDRRPIGGIRGDTPTWSPDGLSIAFIDGGDVRVAARDGSNARTLVRLDARPGGGLDWQPVARPKALAALPPCVIRGSTTRRRLVGSRFADVIKGTSADDRISGLGGSDVIFAFGGNDAVAGGTGKDKISGGSGSDRLDGGAGSDVLHGDAGPDRLIGGRGSDVLSGGLGNDAILARDGERDTVLCGAGRDIVEADRRDRIARDCEAVRRR